MASGTTIQLSADEALVLYDWIQRFNRVDHEAGVFDDQAEQRALWNLEALLESALVEPFSPDYSEKLSSARSRLRDADG